MEQPHLWYQCMLQCAVVWMATCSMFLLTTTSSWMGLPLPLTPATMARTYLWGAATLVVVWTTLYLVWVHLLHLTYPVPMIGAIACIAGAITC